MQFPFKIIESKISSRKQFEMVDGYQPTHSLFYLKKGSFIVEIDGINMEIQKGDCFILPDYIHFKRSVLNPIEFVYIKFACIPTCPYSFSLPYGKVNFTDEKRFISNISTLERLITSDSPLYSGYREHLLMDILFQIYFEQNPINSVSQETVCYDELVRAAVEYIDDNLNKKLLISDICCAVGTNMSTLNFKFRREFDMSIGQFIMNERMKIAKHLLISTTYNISEIALRVGFDNVYYFSNAFKKFNGVSPSFYRN